MHKRMEEKLEEGDAIDVSDNPRIGPYYVLRPGEFREGMDYCDAQKEAWIWSIGEALHDVTFEHEGITHLVPKGTVLASRAADLYQNRDFGCLWLR